MNLSSITIANDRNGYRAYALITTRTAAEAQSFLGEGEQVIEARGSMLRVKPIAIGASPASVCCKIIDQG